MFSSVIHRQHECQIFHTRKLLCKFEVYLQILGVNRKSINRWRNLQDAPKPLSNGKHNVAKWQAFVKKNGLKEIDSPEEEELKSRKLLAEVKQAELKLKVMEGTYVPIEKVCKYRIGEKYS